MRRYRYPVIAIIGFSLFAMVGCGKVERQNQIRQAHQPVVEPANDSAANADATSSAPSAELGHHSLKPWIALPLLDAPNAPASIPGLQISPGAEADLLLEKERIQFQKVIQWPSPEVGNLYLVWKKDAFESPIDLAYYEFERSDVLNRAVRSKERRNASFDQSKGTWFIPLLDVIGGNPAHIDPTVSYTVCLELHLRNGDVLYFQVVLRFLGSLPKIPVSRVFNPKRVPSSAAAFMAELRGDGYALLEDEVVNPTPRPLKLYVRLRQGTLTLKSVLAHSFFTDPNRPKVETFESNSHVLLDRIIIHHDGGTEGQASTTTHLLKIGEWTPIELGPNEKLTLRWMASVFRNSTRCNLPAAFEQVFRWTTTRKQCGGSRGEGDFCRETVENHEARRPDSWTFQGAILNEEIRRDLVLGEPGIPQSEAFKDGRVETLSESAGKVTSIAGSGVPLDYPDFACQGVF